MQGCILARRFLLPRRSWGIYDAQAASYEDQFSSEDFHDAEGCYSVAWCAGEPTQLTVENLEERFRLALENQ